MSKLEIYYVIFFIAVYILLISYLYVAVGRGWQRRSRDEIFLLLLGFLVGILCTLNVTGFFMNLYFIIDIIVNRDRLRTKRKNWENIYTMDRLLYEKDLEEEDFKAEIMPISAQVLIVLVSELLGGFIVMMKYTGDTGLFLPAQFSLWFQELFTLRLGQKEELSFITVILLLVFVILMSLLKTCITKYSSGDREVLFKKKKEKEPVKVEVAKPKTKPGYIENPLPGPKKHIKRSMEFRDNKKKDDFDFDIDDFDDFDV